MQDMDRPPSNRDSLGRMLDSRGQLFCETPSLPWERLRHVGDEDSYGMTYERWENSCYYCSVRRYKKGFFIKNSPYILIGISNNDDTSYHDWRDFQHIKNNIAGRDWEAVELYPSESRLKDPSNRFYIWCVPKHILKFGLPGGRVKKESWEADAPQRPFHIEKEPEHGRKL